MRRSERIRIVGAFLAGIVFTAVVLALMTFVFHRTSIVRSSKLAYYQKLDAEFGKYYSIRSSVDENGIYSIDEDKLDEKLGDALMSSLEDPYAKYYTASEYEKLQRNFAESYTGIGVSLEESDGKLLVSHVVKDSPAKKGGLREGDQLVKVDGKRVKSVTQASEKMDGEAGTDVELELKRGGQTITVTLTRSEVEEDSVEYKFYHADSGKKVGYIRIRHFGESTSDSFEDAIESVVSQDVAGVIIDVRDNSGGLKDEGVKCADRLLPAGTILVEKDKQGEEKVTKSDGNEAEFNYVVLVNGGTASAAEIFAGAIQANHGGKLIGTKTYGKGVIQSIQKLDDGTAYKYTTEEYFLPDGTAINGKGIEPDIKADDDTALSRGIQELAN